MKTKAAGVFALVVLASGSLARAQFWGGYYSSTVQEGAQHGFADVVRSAGMASLLGSEAAINAETAWTKALDNDQRFVQTYFTLRKMNHDYRLAEQGSPPTAEQAYRWAHRDAPRPLNSYEYDPLTGQVTWPVVLQDPEYAPYRNALDRFFQMRAEHPRDVKVDNYFQAQNAVEAWLMDLKVHIAKYKPNDYVRAKGMIESLGHELSNG